MDLYRRSFAKVVRWQGLSRKTSTADRVGCLGTAAPHATATSGTVANADCFGHSTEDFGTRCVEPTSSQVRAGTAAWSLPQVPGQRTSRRRSSTCQTLARTCHLQAVHATETGRDPASAGVHLRRRSQPHGNQAQEAEADTVRRQHAHQCRE